ncbi:hypothetical protein TSMEX_002385 [Taenia solium]
MAPFRRKSKFNPAYATAFLGKISSKLSLDAIYRGGIFVRIAKCNDIDARICNCFCGSLNFVSFSNDCLHGVCMIKLVKSVSEAAVDANAALMQNAENRTSLVMARWALTGVGDVYKSEYFDFTLTLLSVIQILSLKKPAANFL